MQLNFRAVENCERPRCSGCEFVRGSCKPYKVKTTNNNPIKEQDLKKDSLLTGQILSSHNYISRDPGRL